MTADDQTDSPEPVRYEAADGVAILTLDRPHRRNAMNASMREALMAGLDRADADDAVRAIVIEAEGPDFCVGADLAGGAATFDKRSDTSAPVPDGAGVLALRIYACNKPVIGALRGAAVGVGLTMTLPMDFRVAATDARFGCVFVRRGLVPDGCSSWFLPRIVGIGTALDWMCTGRVFDAAEAHAAGLVTEVVAPDEVGPRARRIAAEIAMHTSEVSVALTRQLLWRMLGADHPMSAHRLETVAIRSRAQSNDLIEGIASFREKRLPAFPDRIGRDLPDIFRST